MPFGLATTVPCGGSLAVPMPSADPSRSESLASTLIVTGVPAAVVALSLAATGASLTGVTVTDTCPVSVPPWPSAMV